MIHTKWYIQNDTHKMIHWQKKSNLQNDTHKMIHTKWYIENDTLCFGSQSELAKWYIQNDTFYLLFLTQSQLAKWYIATCSQSEHAK